MEEERDYYNNKLQPLFQDIIQNTLKTKPVNPVDYLIDYLIEKGNYQNLYQPISATEEIELNNLRKKYSKYLRTDLKQNNKPILPDKKRIGISAEAYGEYNKFTGFESKVYPKSSNQTQKIYETVRNCVFFTELNKKNMKIVIDAMKESKFKAGEYVIKEGDDGDKLYFVESGTLECTKRGIFLKYYKEGSSFGELALLYNAPRAATLKAIDDCVLWELDRETFKYLVRFQNEQKQTRYFNFLKSIDIFSNLSDFHIRQISEALKEKRMVGENVIIRAGDQGDEFFIVEKGAAFATVLDSEGGHQKIKFYSTGDYFGELALLKQTPRACNIFSETDITLLVLDRSSFKRLLGPLNDYFEKNSEVYKKYSHLINS